MTMASTTPLRFIIINMFILAMMNTNRRPLIRHAEAAFTTNHHQLPYRQCQYYHHRCHHGRPLMFPFQRSTTSNNIHHRRLSSSKEDEIAALEEKLAQLKKESTAAEAQEETTAPIAATQTTAATAAVASSNDSIKSQPYEEMLTEKWKESLNGDGDDGSSDSGIGGTIVKVVGGLALLVVLSAFSQVPVGQENLDKYSTAKPSTTIDLGDLNRSKKSEFEI